ncbi:MAG TPA: glycosyltransferase [Chloroflexi bacterium]|nr:glycosyltransferase [Chloroflexota bacterium]
MLQRVELGQLRLDAYREIIGDEAVEAILRAAAPLRGLRVLHVNATAFGGGVAEILGTLVPLMADVGLEAEWRIIEGSDAFFEVTKACHNGLQGMDLPFTAEMQATWRQYNALNARWFEGEFDVVVVHDPQPLGLLSFTEGRGARHWVWRCHIDTSEPNPAYWDFFKPYIEGYRAVIFTMREYVGPGVEASRVHVIPPSIDPLSPKNRPVAFATARQAMVRFGIDQARPVALQVSRFDPWKDQLGVIDAYREAKETEEGLQLALIGSLASDDPEAGRYLGRVRERAGGDPDIHIYQNLPSEEVAAFQAGSDVVLQKSLREGFGLTVSETLWKGRPVIGGRAGGIPLQIIDGENGFLVTTVAECADRILYLVRHPRGAELMGRAGREHVRRNFVITRLLADYLELFGALMQVGEANGREAGAEAPTG